MRDRHGRAHTHPVLVTVGTIAALTALTLGPLAFSLGIPGGGFAGDVWRILEPVPTALDLTSDPTAERDAQNPGRQRDGTIVLEDGSEYRFLDEQPGDDGALVPLTWSSCHPIRFVVDPDGAPETFAQDVRVVMAELHKLTGLTFLDAGTDGDRVRWRDPATGPTADVRGDERLAALLIRWSTPDDVPELEDDGVGLATSWSDWDASGTEFWTSAVIDLDVELAAWGEYEGTGEYLPILRHEMGHVLGLDHVDDPAELMHPSSDRAWTFERGDVTGLGALGQGPCAVE